jgi:hypothetical protein
VQQDTDEAKLLHVPDPHSLTLALIQARQVAACSRELCHRDPDCRVWFVGISLLTRDLQATKNQFRAETLHILKKIILELQYPRVFVNAQQGILNTKTCDGDVEDAFPIDVLKLMTACRPA